MYKALVVKKIQISSVLDKVDYLVVKKMLYATIL
jgi:hypothetical protein